MIPKTIHYCWFGGKPMPTELKKYIKTWKKKCPDYEIKEWNESNFDINSNEFVKAAYLSKKWAFVSDYVRLYVIYKYGGIYLDTDVELLKNLDHLLNNELFLGIQQNDSYATTGLGFGATPKNIYVKQMLDVYDGLKFDSKNVINLACPILVTDVLKKYGYKIENRTQVLCDGAIIVYSSEYFDPIAPGSSKNLMSQNSYSVHHYTSSWLSKKTILKRKLCNLIGQNNVNKIRKFFRKNKNNEQV